MAAPRRKVVTYGKRANKGHDLFSQLEPDQKIASIRTPPYTRDADSDDAASTPDRSDSAMYDIPSSDEDVDFAESVQKRRRLTPVALNKHASSREVSPVKKAIPIGLTSSQKAPQGERTTTGKLSNKTTNARQPKASQKKTYSRAAPGRATKSAIRSPSVSPASAQSRSSSQQPLTPPKSMGSIEEALLDSVASSTSIPTPEGTPRQTKRMHDLLNERDVAETPSKLGLSQLRIRSGHASPDDSPSDGELHKHVTSKPPNKLRSTPSRTRLIDALGPTSAPVGRATAEELDDTEDESLPMDSSIERAPKEDSQPITRPTKPAARNSQPLQATGPRLTYAKQRSYLSDAMVDEIPPVSALSSQRSQTSTAIDEFDMLDTEEDAGAGIRSIHELRKAGETVRFQESLDSIFEDVSSNSKGRRITGHIQLGSKLKAPAFRTQFVSHAMDQRLTKRLAKDTGVLDLSLECILCAMLLHDGQPSSRTVQATATSLMPHMLALLQEERTIEALVADRKQNLSKAIRKDVCSFGSEVLRCDLWESVQRPTTLTPQMVALRLMDIIGRQLRELNESSFQLHSDTVEHLINMLLDGEPPMDQTSAVCRTGLLVSILEVHVSKIASFDNSQVRILARLAAIGPVLSMLSSENGKQDRQLQSLMLRLVLNITNNNPIICEAFAEPELITAIVQVILIDFVHLTPTDGSKGEETDAVLLSLGAAINLAEASESARRLISTTTPVAKSGTLVDNLLTLFLSNISEDEEEELHAASTTIGEGQNLVAFGYLSVLISILCVEPEALQVIRKRLPGGNTSKLQDALRDFLGHFRKVDEAVEGGLGELTRRFEEVERRLVVVSNLD